jgi:hypothetical protein
VSVGVAWASPGIAFGEPDAALEACDRDGPPQTFAALSSNAVRTARAATDASGAAVSRQDWLATRSNIQTGTSSRRSEATPVRLQRNAAQPVFSTTS